MCTLALLPYLEPLLTRPQQPDNLCGPYWIALLLQVLGGISTSAIEVAIAAQTILPNRAGTWTPPGAQSLRGEGYDQIPTVSAIEHCGTSLAGLMQATQKLSHGEFCLLPLQTPHWEVGLTQLWQLCQTRLDWQIVPLLNSHTGYFWGSQLSPAQLLGYLNSGQRNDISPPDWSVGHFALLAGQIRGTLASLYAILDTYPQLGWAGLHLQPSSVLAASLVRPDYQSQGGVALFVSRAVRSHVEQAVIDRGFEVAVWDNGTPAPAG
ncbi:MAG: hypothetical protein AAFU71_11035 [Cyanobacteria bacterium J06632_22]